MRTPSMMEAAENSMSSVSRCHFQPPAAFRMSAAMKKPVPDTAQEVFSVRRAWFKNFASRRNHTP